MSHHIIVSKHTLQRPPEPSIYRTHWMCIVQSIQRVVIQPIWGLWRDFFTDPSTQKKRPSDPPMPVRIRGNSLPKRTSSTNLLAEATGSIPITDPGYEPDYDVEKQRRLSDPNWDTIHEKYRIFRDSPSIDQLENSTIDHPVSNNRPFYSKREIALYKSTLLICTSCKHVIPVGCEVLCEQNERFCTERCLKRWRYKIQTQGYKK